MDLTTPPSGRTYTALPIDPTKGFPQSFSFTFNTVNYLFTLYVDIEAKLLANWTDDFLSLPGQSAFLVARVDTTATDGSLDTVFLRKIVPELEYEIGNIALYFPQQTISPQNLNGQGEFGSIVAGGIALR
jgi:hypothetical protein